MEAVDLFSFTQNMSGATVVDWLVADGATVEAGDELVEVESEKAVQVIPAPVGGVVSIEVPAGEQVDVGTTLARIDDGSEAAPSGADSEASTDSPTPAITQAGPESDGAPGGAAAGDRLRASPAARRLAREHDLALGPRAGEGSGPEGALIERDIAAVIDDGAEPDRGRAITERRQPGELRRTVAERMTASAREIPQVTLHRSVSAGPLFDVKERLAADVDVDVSVEDFVVAAAADALVEHPAFNAIYEDGSHALAGAVNVGVAVDIDRGLVTPVIRDAADRGLVDIHRERQRLVERVRAGEYSMADLSDGTFTVTNLGALGVETFDPLVNPPEVAILGVGAVSTATDPETEKPVRRLSLSLSFDHRPNDGADAARFLDSIVDGLQHPLGLLEWPP